MITYRALPKRFAFAAQRVRLPTWMAAGIVWMLAVVSPALAPAQETREVVPIAPPGEITFLTDLWGNDYHRISVQTVFECRDACAADGQCLAWTFVRAGIKDDEPVCYFKNPVPTTAYGDTCCSSGIAAPRAAEAPPPAAGETLKMTPARVNGDVELYDEPGGDGTVIGELEEDSEVHAECREDQWCYVGQMVGLALVSRGWVWGEFLDF